MPAVDYNSPATKLWQEVSYGMFRNKIISAFASNAEIIRSHFLAVPSARRIFFYEIIIVILNSNALTLCWLTAVMTL